MGFFKLGTNTPTVREREVFNYCPMALSLKPDSATTHSIAGRASALTGPLLFKARETVAMDTPASLATSFIVSVLSTMNTM